MPVSFPFSKLPSNYLLIVITLFASYFSEAYYVCFVPAPGLVFAGCFGRQVPQHAVGFMNHFVKLFAKDNCFI